jgi:hypothetical protein
MLLIKQSLKGIALRNFIFKWNESFDFYSI